MTDNESRFVVPSRDPDPSADTGPAIPSFGSLRDPRRRSAIDLLFPAEQPSTPPAPAPPRPPEWIDLLHLGVHVGRAVVALPLRVVRRLLGG